MRDNRTLTKPPHHLSQFYITRINWLISQGREDLIGPIADEYDRHLSGASTVVDLGGWRMTRSAARLAGAAAISRR